MRISDWSSDVCSSDLAKGGTSTAEIRNRMQRTMQNHAAVFRTGETLSEGVKKIREVHAGFADVKVSDRSLVWNSDLIETLELQNLLGQAVATMVSAEKIGRAHV